MRALFLEEQNVVKVVNLKENVFGGAFLNNATTTATLLDLNGTTLANATLSYASNSPGIYEGFIDTSLITTLSEGTEYEIETVVTSGQAQAARWLRRFIAVHRRE